MTLFLLFLLFLPFLLRHYIFLLSFRYVPFDHIVADADGRRFDAVKAAVDDGKGVGDVEEGIGLFLSKDFLYPRVT